MIPKTYDHWKTTNPDDERLGPVCVECGAPGDKIELHRFDSGWICVDCITLMEGNEEPGNGKEDPSRAG